MELVTSTKLLPKEVKYLGYIAAVILLAYSILVKFIHSFAITDEDHLINIFFIISLVLIIGSKSKIEDERVQFIRYYTHSLVSGLLVGFILANELNQRYESYLPHLSAVLSLYVIQYLYLYKYSGDWIIQNKGMYYTILILVGVVLIFVYKYLWH